MDADKSMAQIVDELFDRARRMDQKPFWLTGWTGQSVDELLALEGQHEASEITWLFDSALGIVKTNSGRDHTSLSKAEWVILAVEGAVRDVFNGGYAQFFCNCPNEATIAVEAFEAIGCPVAAELTRKALKFHGATEPWTAEGIDAAFEIDTEESEEDAQRMMYECDFPFQESTEPIAERLLEYIKLHRDEIRLPESRGG